MPRLPERRTTPPKQESLSTVLFVLIIGVFLTGIFISLIAIVIPGAGQMAAAVLLLGLFFVVQYFLWGRWMYAYLLRKEDEETAKRTKESADVASAESRSGGMSFPDRDAE